MAAPWIIQILSQVRGVERTFFSLLSLEGWGGERERERVFSVVGPKQAFCMCKRTNQFEEEEQIFHLQNHCNMLQIIQLITVNKIQEAVKILLTPFCMVVSLI